MYWSTLYWDIYAKTIIPLWIVSEDISFNDYWLQNDSISINYFNPYDTNEIEYNTFNLPRNNWVWFLSKFWRDRPIVLKGTIKHSTAEEFEAKVDEFKTALRWQWKIFQYKQSNWNFRRIKATLTNIKFEREHYNITFTRFEATFQANEPFWYDKVLEQKLFTWINISPFSEEYTNNGNEISELQTFLLFWISAVTEVSMTINNRTITFTWGITWGDTLLIDCLNKKIELNWVRQDYSWTFPILNPWFNSVVYTITWSFTCDISTIFRNNYL